jgi:hypothetical protein
VLVASAFSLFFSHAQRGHAQDYRFHYKRENYGYHHLSAMYEVVSQGVERETRRGTSFPRARPLRHNINTPLACFSGHLIFASLTLASQFNRLANAPFLFESQLTVKWALCEADVTMAMSHVSHL